MSVFLHRLAPPPPAPVAEPAAAPAPTRARRIRRSRAARAMRVMFVNHTAAVSGSERSLLTLMASLPESVQPLLAAPPGRLADEAERLAVPLAPIASTAGSLRLNPVHTPRALGEMSLAAMQLHRRARAYRPDVVDANSIRAGIELGLARVAPAAGVVHVRDCLPPGPVTSATMRLIAATARTVVANSQHTAGCVRAAAPQAHLEVVHPGIDLQRFDPAYIDRDAVRARLGAAGASEVLLGVVAQLSPWKGQRTAIEALARLCEQGVDAHLLLIGSAKFVARSTRFDNRTYVEELRALVDDAGIAARVSWLGERSDVAELIRALDVLLLPSEEEPFGRALLEAMALEVPVLATSVGGPCELVREGVDGYLVAPDRPAAWARAVLRVIDGPERGAAMGRAGRERIAEGFDAAHHARATLAVYERALA
jgi:glycosyltransferase involved in cell wall biosynthesis